MHSLFGFGNIKADIVLIAVLSVTLAVILIYNYWQKKLEEKATGAETRNIYNKSIMEKVDSQDKR